MNNDNSSDTCSNMLVGDRAGAIVVSNMAYKIKEIGGNR
jgi:hypothetical protein